MFGIKKKGRKEEVSYTKKHPFDEMVIDKINDFMTENMLSLSLVANKAGMTYDRLYQLLHKNKLIKLKEYVDICDAFGVDLDFFVREKKVTRLQGKEKTDYFEPF